MCIIIGDVTKFNGHCLIPLYPWLIFGISGLRQSLDNITSEERSTIGVNDDDIFFSFIPEFQFEQTKQSIMLGKILLWIYF